MSNTFTEGEAFAPQRSLFNALGFTKEEMRKPLVGIVSSYNEIVEHQLYSQRSQYVMELPWDMLE